MKPETRSYRRYDGGGLYIEIAPTGSKLWRYKYRYGGKEKRLALGAYPAVKLGEARRKRDAARLKLDEGMDPSLDRKRAKARQHVAACNTFAAVAEEYVRKRQREGLAEATATKARWFLSFLAPAIGTLPLHDIDPQLLLSPLKRLETRGRHETAKKTRSFASRVFRYGVATGRCASDPAALLSGALISHKPQHYAAVLDKERVADLLKAIDGYDSPISRLALLLLAHVFVRPGELRLAEWKEIDFDKAVWVIPAHRTKMRRPHVVPLSTSALQLLRQAHRLSGPDG